MPASRNASPGAGASVADLLHPAAVRTAQERKDGGPAPDRKAAAAPDREPGAAQERKAGVAQDHEPRAAQGHEPGSAPSADGGPAGSGIVPVPGRSALARAVLLLCGVAALVASVAVSVRIGTTDIGYADLARTFGFHLGLDVEPLPRLVDSLVWDLRVPRVLMAALVGASLAVCGAVLQAVTRNALADPYLLGVSSGASTGAVAVVVLGVGAGTLGVAGGAFTGALLSFGLLALLLRRSGLDSTRIVLTGVVVGQLFTALTSLVLMASADADTTRAVTHWLLGSMAPARWDSVVLCALVTLCGLVVIGLYAHTLDGLSFGADTASSLGIDVRATRRVLLVVTALLTSVAVASVGAIGFVGLIVPHGTRFLAGPLHRVLLPCTALAGAVFLVWTDALARVAFAPREVPVGVLTALLGVPLFLLVLRKRGEL